MPRWECRVMSGPAAASACGGRRRSSRCLPRLSDSITVQRARLRVASRGTRRSDAVSWLPANARCSARAVRKTVSPSGMGLILPVPR